MPRSTNAKAVAVACALFARAAVAQVVYDGSLTTAGEAPLDGGGTTWQIESERGQAVSDGDHTNLFYSFERFDVPAAQAAEFRPAAEIDSIIARVTGGSLSRIDGDVRVSAQGGGAGPDLFLLNPAGVLFGGNTRVDMNGALRVSSASGVGFAEGGFFSARDASALPPDLGAEPALLRFDEGDRGDIAIEGRLVSNDAGGRRDASEVALVGRDVSMRGPGTLSAEQATLSLGAVGMRALDVPLDLRAAPLGQGSAGGGRIALDAGSSSSFNASTRSPNPDQGRIVIRGGELVLDRAGLLAGGNGSNGEDGTAIDVSVSGTISIRGDAGKIESLSGPVSAPGGLSIRAERLELREGGSIESTHNRGAGQAGPLDIEVDELVLTGASSQIQSLTEVAGAGGDVRIRAASIAVDERARIRSLACDVVAGGDCGAGSGAFGAPGALELEADALMLTNESRIATQNQGVVAGGDLLIRAESLALSGRSSVTTGSTTTTASGALGLEVGRLELTDSAALGTGAIAPVVIGSSPLAGPGGPVTVRADSVRVAGGSQISTSTDGAGDAGSLRVDVTGPLLLSGRLGVDQPSGLFARSGLAFGSPATGDGGSIVVSAGSLVVEQGAQIATTTVGSGRAGEIDVATRDDLSIVGGRVSAISSDVGATGDVRLETGGSLFLAEGAEVVAEAPVPDASPIPPGGRPPAGDIRLSARREIFVEESRIATDSARAGTGNVSLTAGGGIVFSEARLTTNVDSPAGRGGDVRIEGGALVIAGSQITANAEGANADAGDVALVAETGILQSTDSTVEARAELGVAGEIVRTSPETNLAEELGRQAARIRSEADVLAEACLARTSRAGSLARTARPMSVATPDEPLAPTGVDEGSAGPDGCSSP